MMYRIENYITSIILSKVDRYIKNFRREDVKVSLWKGDCVLYNLDLDLDVLEQELNLPVSFMSGHIHQLQIHVPWTRLNSESVQLTINTIECVMKLKTPSRRTSAPTPPINKPVGGEESVAPSSYLTSLVNKILCNLSVTCNNLILKYVEEDIVLSMNIKQLSLTTVNQNWLSEFSELTTTDLILRKLISLVDVTLCLDRRNASGRIESYLKPLLYKCSMVLRLSRSYPSVNSSNSSSTRIALHCDNFNLSISEPQISMLLRLYLLARLAMNQSRELNSANISHSSVNQDFLGEEEAEMGWGSWLWGFVPTISPLMTDSSDMVMDSSSPIIRKFHLGLYVDLCTLDLKLRKTEEGSDWESILRVSLGGCFAELTNNNSDWSNTQVGICSVNLSPVPNPNQETYVDCGEVPKSFYTSSLFANPDNDLTQRPWEYHLSTVTETLMMERAPTFYMDLITIVEKDNSCDLDDNFREAREKQLVRYVVGPICISIGSQLVDKLTVLKESLYSYDYSPYTQLSNHEVNVLSVEELELARERLEVNSELYVAQSTSQFTFFGARVRIYPSDTSYLQQSSGVSSKSGPPYVLLKIKCLDGKVVKPMYPEKLVALSRHLNLPESCITASQTSISLLLVEARVCIVIREAEGPDVFEISNLTLSSFSNNVFNPQNSDDVIKQSSLHIESVSLVSTKPKLMLGWEIIFSLTASNKKNDLLYNTSLLRDCRATNDSIYAELRVCDVECKYLLKGLSECGFMSVRSMDGCTLQGRDAVREIVIATAFPQHDDNLLEVLLQRPVGLGESTIAPLVSFKVTGLEICLGRNLCLYAMYSPQTNHIRAFNIMQTSGSARKISTSSLSSLQKKHQVDQTRSTSDSDILPQSLLNFFSCQEEGVKLMSLVISGEINRCRLVMPQPATTLHPSTPSSTLVFTLGSLAMRSPLGRISYNYKQLPVHIPNWSPDKMNLPWSIFVCEVEGYTERSSYPRLELLSKLSCTVTLAVTTKQDSQTNKVSTVALCLHLDTTPISVSLSHHQVVLVSEVVAALYQVYHALVPPVCSEAPTLPPPVSSTSPPPDSEVNKNLHHSSTNSLSNRTPGNESLEEGGEVEGESVGKIKGTLWLQCTVTKCSLALYSLPSKYSDQHLKYVLDLDDIFMTLDVVSVYHKMKLKIATAHIKHYARLLGNNPWRCGSFSGILMKGNETKTDNKDSDDFLSVTLTRASATNLHKRLNPGVKKRAKEPCEESGYVSEVVVKIQPLDLVFSPTVLGKMLHIIEPLLDQQDLFPLGRHYSTSPICGQSVCNFTTSSLPLLYLDINLMRLFIPISESTPGASSTFDTLYLQVEKVCLSSEAVNPVSRKFVRSDLYERHGSRLTTVPGSSLEDRQYQLDSNITLTTGKWCEVVKAIEVEEEGVVGQNPAVYWNSGQDHQALHRKTAPLLSSLVLSVIVAPPITTAGYIISGLNVEVNIVSEVEVILDVEQVKLISEVYLEVMKWFPGSSAMSEDQNSDSKLVPSPTHPTQSDQQSTDAAPSDSGVESVDGSFNIPRKDVIEISVSYNKKSSSGISQISISTPTSINTKRYHQRTQTVPIDMLVTTKAVVVRLYRTVKDTNMCEPLLFLLLSQPYVALEKQADISLFKGSLYEVEMKHGAVDHTVDSPGDLTGDSYPVALVQNRRGDSDPEKGIPPALINFKSTTQGIRSPSVEVELGRPIKLLLRTSSIDYLTRLKAQLETTFDLSHIPRSSREPIIKKSSSFGTSKQLLMEEKSSMDQLKNYFHPCSIFAVSTKQIVLDFQTFESDGEMEGCLLSVGSICLTGEWSEVGCLSTGCKVSGVCLSVCRPHPRLFAGPWTLSSHLVRDPRVPSLSITVEAGLLAVDLSQSVVDTCTTVVHRFKPYLPSSRQTDSPHSAEVEVESEEHYYRDDLQAGAFQFVTQPSSAMSRSSIPLAYQIIFPTNKTMAWTYPAPRAITSVTLLPLPTTDTEDERCSLRVCVEYYECGVWRSWLEVKASAGRSVDATIPGSGPPCVASSWRAVIRSQQPSLLHASALATALRINSIYSPALVPSINLRVDLHCLQVSVWTRQLSVVSLPDSLSRFRPDSSLPSSYPLCTLFLQPVQTFSSYWRSGDMSIDVDTRPRVDVLNPRTLVQHCCINPFSLSLKVSLLSPRREGSDLTSTRRFSSSACSDATPSHHRCTSSHRRRFCIDIISSPLVMRVAPPLCHTLLAATKGAVLTPYVVCNDSALPIRFGQCGTVEDIWLDPLCCNFYSWRTCKQETRLRFSLSRFARSKSVSDSSSPLEGVWSEGVSLDEERIIRFEVEDDNYKTVIVHVAVKQLSSILTQVTVGGQLVVYNMLDCSSVEARVVSSSISEVQQCLCLEPSTRAPSLLLSPISKYSLRLSIVPNRWSGLVPLMTNNNVWMVKIPMEVTDEYISAWCQIVQEEGSPNYPKIMVILSPLYLLRSYLPCESNVVITTEGFVSRVSQVVPGRGSTSNLKALGTATHSHILDFNIEGVETEGGGGIPLSYELVEGRGPAPSPIPALPRLLELADSRSHMSADWPPIPSLTGVGLSPKTWGHAQPPNTLTHVKVKFGCDLLKVTNSLLVELQPWALLVNTTGFPLYVVRNAVTLATLPHFSIVAPPHLQGFFRVGLEVESGVHLSSDVELSQNQVFYMPHISGIVPLNGQLSLNIPANDKMLCLSLESSMWNGMRLLHACPLFTIVNLSSLDLKVAPLLVFKEHTKLLLPRVLDKYSQPLPSQSSDKPIGVGLTQWYRIGEEGSRVEGKHYLLFERNGRISCPVPLSLGRERHVHTALLPDSAPTSDSALSTCPQCNVALTVVVQVYSGRTYITIDNQPTPQLLIHNMTSLNLTVSKASPTRGGAGVPVDDFPEWDWRLSILSHHRAVYFLNHPLQTEPLALVISRPGLNCWSNSISVVASASGRLVSVPQSYDLTAVVIKRGSTLHVRLSPANQKIVAASDIRSRLLNNLTPAGIDDARIMEKLKAKDINEESSSALEATENRNKDAAEVSANLTAEFIEDLDERRDDLVVRADLKNITMVLCREAPSRNYMWIDVASLSMDNVTVASYPSTNQSEGGAVERLIDIKVGEFQLDNVEYQRGGYDFGVVLLCKSDSDNVNRAALRLSINLDQQSTPALQDIIVEMNPMVAYVEDVYVTQLKEYLARMLPEVTVVCTGEPEIEEGRHRDRVSESVLEPVQEEGAANEPEIAKEEDDELFNVSDSEVEGERGAVERRSIAKYSATTSAARKTSMLTRRTVEKRVDALPFPEDVLLTALELSRPLRLRNFSVSSVDITVSVHTSTKFYIALDNSPLRFASFERQDMLTTAYRLGHALSLHYFLGAIYGTGWALGSVELLGAPVGLARSVGTGLKSFVTLPCRGAVDQGPAGFFTGFLHGSASLVKHLTAGTVMCVTKLAGSWSRTLDRLTLEEEDLKYAEEMRRIRPDGLTQALKLGLTELGVNILGGVGGLAQKPLEYVSSGNQSLASSLGLALVGVITRPLAGAAELLSLTGQGLLAGAGWTQNHLPKHEYGVCCNDLSSESKLRYSWKFADNDETLVTVVEGSCYIQRKDGCSSSMGEEQSCVAMLTSRRLCLIDSTDLCILSLDLLTVTPLPDSVDPLRINFVSLQDSPDSVETFCKRRIEEFIRDSGRALRKSPSFNVYHEPSTTQAVSDNRDSCLLQLFLQSPSARVYLLSLLDLAKRHRSDSGFNVLC